MYKNKGIKLHIYVDKNIYSFTCVVLSITVLYHWLSRYCSWTKRFCFDHIVIGELTCRRAHCKQKCSIWRSSLVTWISGTRMKLQPLQASPCPVCVRFCPNVHVYKILN